jgi:hypothetical protein
MMLISITSWDGQRWRSSVAVQAPESNDDFDPSHHGDTALWLAVIERAWLDCFEPIPAGCKKDEERISAKSEARHFLFDTCGAWEASRELVCSFADVDPDYLRVMALLERRSTARAQRPLTGMVASGLLSVGACRTGPQGVPATPSPATGQA